MHFTRSTGSRIVKREPFDPPLLLSIHIRVCGGKGGGIFTLYYIFTLESRKIETVLFQCISERMKKKRCPKNKLTSVPPLCLGNSTNCFARFRNSRRSEAKFDAFSGITTGRVHFFAYTISRYAPSAGQSTYISHLSHFQSHLAIRVSSAPGDREESPSRIRLAVLLFLLNQH